MKFEAVIGLEVHVQIRTASKMFTRVAAGYGHPENTLTDPVILALPGALPVLNKAALDAIIKTGLMLGCEIAPVTRWDRKNYFYPDSPKNYQLSQYDQPVCRHGTVEIELPGASLAVMGEHRSIPLTRIHLEEDVGKLNHEAADSLIDYNRAGTPLMEIVTEPALHSPDEAFAFLTALRLDLRRAGISDCDMEKGQLRCDANISIRPVGESRLGTKVELKNLNSISYVRDGIALEIKRQTAVLSEGGVITQETRLYDGETGRSAAMRSKEMAHDYRYFPDPDLVPVRIDEAWKDRLRRELPEKSFESRQRYQQYGTAYPTASAIVPEPSLSKLYDGALVRIKNWNQSNSTYAKYVTPYLPVDPVAYPAPQIPYLAIPSGQSTPVNLAQITGSLIVNDLQRELKQRGLSVPETHLNFDNVAALSIISASGQLSATDKNLVINEIILSGKMPDIIIAEKNIGVMSTDTDQLEGWCDAAIANDPKSADQVRAGNTKAINALKGAVMKLSAGQANPKLVDGILKQRLGV